MVDLIKGLFLCEVFYTLFKVYTVVMENPKHQNKIGALIKNLFPRKFIKKKSETHFGLILLDRWRYVRGESLLDIGCGHCQFINLNPKKIKVYGFDMLVAPEAENDRRIKIGNLDKALPFKKNQFDTVTLFHVLEHLDDGLNSLRRIAKVIKMGGRIIVVVPNWSFKHFYDDYTHKRPYTKKSLYRILYDSGFKNIKIINGPCFNKLISSIFFLLPKMRFRLEKLFGIINPSEFIAIADYTGRDTRDFYFSKQ